MNPERNSLSRLARGVMNRISNLRLVDIRKLHIPLESNHLKKLIRHYEIDCVFDVGANVGQYAQMLRSKAKYKGLIISFEPSPEAAAKLRELSKNDPLWVIKELALSDTNGELTFHIMRNSQFSSLSEPRHDEVALFETENSVTDSIQVDAETLDSAYPKLKEKYQFSRPFLKMDTQGFDVTIVKNAQKVIGNFIGLQSELAIKKIYQDSTDFREAISLYEDSGFSLNAFLPNNAGHFPKMIEIDCVMVRSDLL